LAVLSRSETRDVWCSSRGTIIRMVPSGKFIFSVWDSLQHNELAQITHETVSSFFEDNPPKFYKIPFGLHDPEELKGLLADGGFKDTQISILACDGVSPSTLDVSKGLVLGNPVITEIKERGVLDAYEIIAALAKGVADRCGDNPVRSKLQALVCNANG